MRSIDSLIDHLDPEFGLRNFAQTSYTDKSNRSMRCYNMTRKGFSLVAMGFTGKTAIKWKVSYLEAFDAMEAKLMQPTIIELPSPDIRAIIDRVMALEGDCAAMSELLLERREPALPPPVKVRRAPFVRPSVLRRNKKTVIEISIKEGGRK
jgi:Rha family phage regulatory protein